MRLSIKIITDAVLIALVVSFGTFGTYILGRHGNFNIPIHSLLTALYFTITTLSTVGYGDIYPVTSIARIFDIILIVVGLGVFFSTITVLAGGFMNDSINALTGRISGVEKKLLNRHIILIGYGPTNEKLAINLKKEKRRFIILISDKSIVDKLRADGYHAFIIDETSEHDILTYGLNKAEKVVIDVKDKARTLFIALVVKDMIGTKTTTIVADDDVLENRLEGLGFNAVINPSKIAAESIGLTFSKK